MSPSSQNAFLSLCCLCEVALFWTPSRFLIHRLGRFVFKNNPKIPVSFTFLGGENVAIMWLGQCSLTRSAHDSKPTPRALLAQTGCCFSGHGQGLGMPLCGGISWAARSQSIQMQPLFAPGKIFRWLILGFSAQRGQGPGRREGESKAVQAPAVAAWAPSSGAGRTSTVCRGLQHQHSLSASRAALSATVALLSHHAGLLIVKI